MWSSLFGKPKPAAGQTARALADKHNELDAKRKDALAQADVYLERARDIMGYAGQPDRGKRAIAHRLVSMSKRLNRHADSIMSVQVLLTEYMLAMEEQQITTGVASMVKQATGQLTAGLRDADTLTDSLTDAAQVVEDQNDMFQELVREGDQTPYNALTDEDQAELDEELFGVGAQAPKTKREAQAKTGPSEEEKHMQEIQQLLGAAPAPPAPARTETIEPPPKFSGRYTATL
jgi:hypothetical protein